MSEWLRPLKEHRDNKKLLRQFAIEQAGIMLDAANVKFPDGAASLASTEKPEVTLDLVKVIMGSDFIGPEQVGETYGRIVTQGELAQLLKPVTDEMLAKGRELGAILSLRTNRTGDETPITGKWAWQTLEPRLKEEGKGRILYDTDWYLKEKFFTEETPRYNLALAFTTKNVIDGSTDLNYLQQTRLLADFLTQKIFEGQKLPQDYQDAIDELNNRNKELEKLLKDNWRKGSEELAKLAINQRMRRNFPEGIYDETAYLQSTGIRLLPNRWDWTISRTSDGRLVAFGRSAADGADVLGWRPDSSAPRLGVCASWIVSKI